MFYPVAYKLHMILDGRGRRVQPDFIPPKTPSEPSVAQAMWIRRMLPCYPGLL